MSMPCVCSVPMEVRRGCQSSRLLWATMWVLGTTWLLCQGSPVLPWGSVAPLSKIGSVWVCSWVFCSYELFIAYQMRVHSHDCGNFMGSLKVLYSLCVCVCVCCTQVCVLVVWGHACTHRSQRTSGDCILLALRQGHSLSRKLTAVLGWLGSKLSAPTYLSPPNTEVMAISSHILLSV